MKKPNALNWMLLTVLSLLLTSCAPKPPDVPVCENLQQRLATDETTGHLVLKPDPICIKEIGEIECGHCTYIVSGKEVFVGEGKDHLLNKKPWSQIKQEAVLVPAEESYAPLSAYMINACKKMKCSDEVTRFEVKFDSLGNIKKVLVPSNKK